MNKPIIMVEGCPRSGSSLTMQMLHSQGIPCIGEYPSFEDDRFGPLANVGKNLATLPPGVAVKVLDPQLATIPNTLNALVIWLDRDTREQAKSTLKFMGMTQNRLARRTIAASLSTDRAAARTRGLVGRAPTLSLSFETLIEAPLATAQAIASFLAPHFICPDILKMARVVLPRRAACLPYMLEVQLIDDMRRAE